ncbi:MAG: sigma-70 family RNA polymerase sigma factor [Spirochaetota bacterium]
MDTIDKMQVSPPEQQIFEAIYKEHRNDIYAFILHSTRNETSASDLTQDVFYNFIKRYQDTDPIPSGIDARKLLFRIARNLTINYFKSYYQVNVDQVEEINVPNIPLQRTSPDNEPSRLVFKKEIRNILDYLLSQLAEKQRTAIILRYDRELKLKEIGEIMNLSPSGVFRLLDKAEKELIKQAQKIGFEPELYL